METVIRKFGNSKGAIIPASLLKQLGLDINHKVHARVEQGRLIIEPVARKPEYSIDELLACSPAESMVLDEQDKSWLNEDSVGRERIDE